MSSWFDLLHDGSLQPFGQSYSWSPALVWLHALSDGLIAIAGAAMAFMLLRFRRGQDDRSRRRQVVLVGTFLLAAAAAHGFGVWTIWHPHHLVSGGVKTVAALAAVAATIALVRVRASDSPPVTGSASENPWSEGRGRAEAEITRLNQLLQRRVDELQALFNVLPVGVGIAEDPKCQFIRTNDALARMLGVDRQVNASLSAPTPQRPQNFRVLHENRTLTPDELPMQTCARENRKVIDFEETVIRQDGVKIDLLANAVPLQDSAGNAVGCVATFQDVTALKTALASHARYAAIVASSQDAIIGKTLDGRITEWNAAAEKIFGYSAADVIGRSISLLIPADRQEEETSALASAAKGEPIAPFETVRLHRDGRLIDTSIVMSPIREPSGRIVGVSVSARDISLQKRAESQRREMERKLQESQYMESLGVLAGGVAHDFNNLLTGILGNVSLARPETLPGSELGLYLEQIDSAARRAADLCRQMLAYSGRSLFVLQRLDLSELVSSLRPLLDVSLGEHCVLELQLAASLPPVLADASQVRQIVLNTVTNAAEAIGNRPGLITVSARSIQLEPHDRTRLTHDFLAEPGHHVVLEVSDNGPGMDAATFARIFEPFFTTKFTGRGLGLSAVLGIVRGHQGALEVTSEAGRGSTFRVYLPCHPGPAAES